MILCGCVGCGGDTDANTNRAHNRKDPGIESAWVGWPRILYPMCLRNQEAKLMFGRVGVCGWSLNGSVCFSPLLSDVTQPLCGKHTPRYTNK